MAYYNTAKQVSLAIEDSSEGQAMMAGITYAIAHLDFSRREFEPASKMAGEAIKLFAALDDVYRVDMATVLYADIQLAAKREDAAKDAYRRVIQSSRVNRESVHYIRAVLGLAELHVQAGRAEEAHKLLDRLNSDQVERLPAFRDRFSAARNATNSR